MEFVLIFIAGFFVGIGVVLIAYRTYSVGTLRIDRSDLNEPPYMFLELDKGVGDISRKKKVVLKVKNENYISQK